VKKPPNDYKTGPNSRPTNFFLAKISPNSLGDFFLKQISQMQRNLAKMAKFWPNLVTLTFVESVDTFSESHTLIESLSSERLGSYDRLGKETRDRLRLSSDNMAK
jgi:hypothetical protein